MTEYSLFLDNTGNTENKKEVNSLYLFNLYYYYYNRGYSNLILTEITNLLVLVFMVFFMVFLVQCVDFKELIDYNIEEKVSLSHFVKISNFWDLKNNFFIIICLIVFLSYVIIQLISIYASSKKFWKIRKIYKEDLGITTDDLDNLTWNDVSNKIIKYYCEPNLNSYTIALKIMTKENLIISVYSDSELDNNSLKFNKYPLTKLLEWNFIFCFINPLINSNREIDLNIKLEKKKYYEKVQSNINRIFVLNLLFMPILLIFIVLYLILQYGEQFYNNPNLIVNRQWSIKSFWRLRYYNELPHLYHSRLDKSGLILKEYGKQFPSRITETISRFIMFILGSFFLILLLLTFLNENLLINLNISDNKPILWYMGILGGILTIIKSLIYKNVLYDPEKIMKKLSENIDLKEEWVNDCRNKKIKDKIMKLFPLRAVLLLEECYYLILTPYILWFILKKEAVIICDYLINSLITHHSINGFINKNSLFVNYNQIKENHKTEKSFINFQKNYPEWNMSSFLYNQESIYPNINNNIKNDILNSTENLIENSNNILNSNFNSINININGDTSLINNNQQTTDIFLNNF